MENVLLILHLIIAICLIAAVLLQRSEGGALGIGGGGGGMVNQRAAASPLAKLTWGLATAFIATSITLAVLAGGNPAGESVIDDIPLEEGGAVPLPSLPPVEEDGAGGPVELPSLPPEPTAPVPAAPPAAD